jgi:MoxR-like ATPase
VLATQNPLEQEGTYPLPEAQIDRFLFKILVHYPTLTEEKKVMDTVEHEDTIRVEKVLSNHDFDELKAGVEKVTISDEVKEYITRLVQKTRPGSSKAGEKNPNILYGSSPR